MPPLPKLFPLLSFLIALGAHACGPWFDAWLLDEGEDAWSTAPSLIFSIEAAPIIEETPSPFSFEAIDQETAELLGLKRYLAEIGASAEDEEEAIAAYQMARQIVSGDDEFAESVDGDAEPFNEVTDLLPPAFVQYLRGAYYWHRRPARLDLARAAWESLLQEKPAGYRERLVWAHYMLGRSTQEFDPEYARSHFQETRRAAANGFPDPLCLAATSFGWEARTYFLEKEFDTALKLYLQGNASGVEDIPSLEWSTRLAFQQSDKTLSRHARDPQIRRLMSAWIGSYPAVSDPDDAIQNTRLRWLAILQNFEDSDPQSIVQLALIAYQAGELEEAQQWCALSPPTTLAHQWLSAKLALARGNFDEASQYYSEAIRILRNEESDDLLVFIMAPQPGAQDPFLLKGDPKNRVPGELGLIHLKRRDYQEALRTLLPYYWEDAAFLAERVLTTDELLACVNLYYPATDISEEDLDHSEYTPPERLRYLLARRLTREGRLSEALPYFPETRWGIFRDGQDKLEVKNLAQGMDQLQNQTENPEISPRARAEAYWALAQLVRLRGLELMGTELDPDWFVYEADYKRPAASSPERGITSSLLGEVFADRSEIIENSAPKPDQRFHYRYTAADYGWQASQLLPDNDPLTAQILWQSGRWLMNRDPEAADRFYKALVRRNPEIPLAVEADALRWFPKNLPTDPMSDSGE
ncbi:tetratricopeptide repeat protein [Puniceicoccus vermicola]|uniref:Tetratricopeptide repeat protein n=1 Tax=Puniceicoccus vermicola TaxID=388746 RepID=A0A7X1E7Z5_9BACT|nr:hypothetical protein [Puniceicoccus vermicola]MBC2604252.1 hypothetical protein [Puniceicoccus vermicola]